MVTPVNDRRKPAAQPTRVATDALALAGSGPRVVRPVAPGRLMDSQRRPVRYLRLSVTDRCNFRCRYCMPEDGVPFVPRDQVLSFEEMERVVRLFVELGIKRLRLTGGEPLLRHGIVELVGRLAAIDGVEDVAMTTNGVLLPKMAAGLAAGGLQRLNVSLDTLDAERFSEITRGGSLSRVLEGIDAAMEAGLSPLKINAVVVRGVNEHELGAMVRWAGERGAVMRFIEYMPIGMDGFWSGDTFMSVEDMVATLRPEFDVTEPVGYGPMAGIAGEGPARYRDLTPHGGGPTTRVGFITAVSDGFCASCNRVRVTATGTLQECLAVPGTKSLRDRLRAGQSDEDVRAYIEDSLWTKSVGHAFEVDGGGKRVYQPMSVTGG